MLANDTIYEISKYYYNIDTIWKLLLLNKELNIFLSKRIEYINYVNNLYKWKLLLNCYNLKEITGSLDQSLIYSIISDILHNNPIKKLKLTLLLNSYIYEYSYSFIGMLLSWIKYKNIKLDTIYINIKGYDLINDKKYTIFKLKNGLYDTTSEFNIDSYQFNTLSLTNHLSGLYINNTDYLINITNIKNIILKTSIFDPDNLNLLDILLLLPTIHSISFTCYSNHIYDYDFYYSLIDFTFSIVNLLPTCTHLKILDLPIYYSFLSKVISLCPSLEQISIYFNDSIPFNSILIHWLSIHQLHPSLYLKIYIPYNSPLPLDIPLSPLHDSPFSYNIIFKLLPRHFIFTHFDRHLSPFFKNIILLLSNNSNFNRNMLL